jgi:serine/threonine protein kinase
MSPETHQRVRKLFDEALERPEDERLTFLKTACDGDEEALQTAVRLLEAYKPAQFFLEDRPRGIERIGRYLITGELGRGSMGVVYAAIDPIIGRNVAVKVIHMEALADPGQTQFLRERLFREARSAGQLFHPAIVTVLDVGQEGELAFIAMERVDGLSLQRTLSENPGQRLNQPQILDILRQTAAALDFAHRNKVVHCDVKPGNIILGRNEAGGGAVKLTDFGIAKIASTQYHTRTGLLMGTPSYMSPEQIEAHPVDGRSDQFSLAVVAFELLTGAVPFRGETLAGLAHTIVYGTTPSARAANPQVLQGVDAILQRALAKSPEDRFPSCTQFVSALEASLSGAPPVVAGTKPRRNVWMAVAAVLVLALAAGLYRLTTHPAPAPATSSQSPPTAPPLAAPVIVSFIPDPASLKAGSSATLRWEVKGAVKGHHRSGHRRSGTQRHGQGPTPHHYGI